MKKDMSVRERTLISKGGGFSIMCGDLCCRPCAEYRFDSAMAAVGRNGAVCALFGVVLDRAVDHEPLRCTKCLDGSGDARKRPVLYLVTDND